MTREPPCADSAVVTRPAITSGRKSPRFRTQIVLAPDVGRQPADRAGRQSVVRERTKGETNAHLVVLGRGEADRDRHAFVPVLVLRAAKESEKQYGRLAARVLVSAQARAIQSPFRGDRGAAGK